MTGSNSLIRLSFKARLSRMIGVPRLPSLFALLYVLRSFRNYQLSLQFARLSQWVAVTSDLPAIEY